MNARETAMLPPASIASDDARRCVRSGLLAIFIGFVVCGGWIALAPIAGAVIAQGSVKVDMNRKTIQHQEGGIVKEILVRDGERVRQGQPLLLLGDVREIGRAHV